MHAHVQGMTIAGLLSQSYFFYEAQQSGVLPAKKRVDWRGNSALKDVAPNGLSLVGGHFDAGGDVCICSYNADLWQLPPAIDCSVPHACTYVCIQLTQRVMLWTPFRSQCKGSARLVNLQGQYNKCHIISEKIASSHFLFLQSFVSLSHKQHSCLWA